MSKVSIIVATAKNNVIGQYGDMPWRGKMPADMVYFASQTMGAAVIMGRKTYESIPPKFRPLKGRTNIVLSSTKDFNDEGCITMPSLRLALDYAKDHNLEAFIAGGGSVYQEALAGDYQIDRVLRTLIDTDIAGDTFFPNLDDSWQMVKENCHNKDDKNAFGYCFQTYERVTSG